MMWLVRLALRPNYNYLVQMTIRQSTSSTEIGRKWRAIWKDFVQKTDFMKSFNSDGIWGFYRHHYTWHDFENFMLHVQMLAFVNLIAIFSYYGFKKVEVITDRSWKGDNRAFLWYAIEDRFSHEFAYVFEPIKEAEPPKLLQMRALQKEMCAEALKRGTWFLVPQHD